MNNIFINYRFRDILSRDRFARIVSYLLGIVFLFSGIVKIIGINDFIDEFAQYVDYYLEIPFFIEYREILAITICLIEIVIGVVSIVMVRNVFITIVTTLLLLVFVYFTCRNYYYPAFGYGITSCGCFGDFIILSPGWSFAKSMFLLGLSTVKLYILLNKNYQYE